MSDLIERLLANGLDECDEAAALIRTLDAELAALREARGVRVKPLVWVVGSNEVHAFARSETDLGLYQILSVPTDSDHRLLLPNGDYKHFASYTSAKAAAQADYERRILAALEPAPVTPAEAADDLDDEGEIIRRLLVGETICYSQDGDDAWLSGGDKASLSERAILQLRKAGCLTRKNDDEGRVSWDEASAALRAIADAGEEG